MTTAIAETSVLDQALDVVGNSLATPEDRGAAYALLHQVQLRINRVLRKAKDELILHMEREGLRSMGPLSVKATAIDPRYPVNDEGNWADAGVQEELQLLAKIAPDFIHRVPEHYEIRTAELGAAVHAGDPVAIQLYTMCKERRWRVEDGRRLSLAVTEAKAPKERAA
jgi:hypothetical protein